MTTSRKEIDVPRGTYTGAPLCGPRGVQRFYQCAVCGGWVDGADLDQVIEHEGQAVPAAAIEISIAQAS